MEATLEQIEDRMGGVELETEYRPMFFNPRFILESSVELWKLLMPNPWPI